MRKRTRKFYDHAQQSDFADVLEVLSQALLFGWPESAQLEWMVDRIGYDEGEMTWF